MHRDMFKIQDGVAIVEKPLICIILDHAYIIKFWRHRRHIGTPGPVFFAGVRVSF